VRPVDGAAGYNILQGLKAGEVHSFIGGKKFYKESRKGRIS
jgi:hypothetical protein